MKNAFGDTIAEDPKNNFGDTVEAAPPTAAPAFNTADLFQGVQNWDKVLPRETVSAVDAGLEGADKSAGRMRAANVAFLADRYKTSPDDVVSRLPDFQKQFDTEVMKTGKTYDDAGFYGAVGSQLKKDGEEQGNLGSLTVNLFGSLKAGQTFNQAFEAARAAHRNLPGWDDSRQDLYRSFAKGQWDNLQAKQQYFAAPIKAIADYMAEADQPDKTLTQAGQRTKRRQAAIDLLAQYPSDDASLIMDLASGQAKATREKADEDMNFVEKGARRVERGTFDAAAAFVGAGQELGRRIGSALGDDQGQAAGADRRKAQIARQIDQRVHGEVDPLRENNWVGNALLSTAEAAPRLVSFLSPAGIVANGIATKEEMRGKFEDAGLNAAQADTLSYFTGAAATALNFVGAKMFFGKVPFASKIFDPITQEAGLGAGELFKRAALAAGIEYPIQAAAAFGQHLLPDASQWIAGAFDKQIPGVDFKKTFDQIGDATPETLTGLIPIVLFGAGMATFHDRAAGVQYVQNRNRLLTLGFHPTEVESILQTQDPLAIQQKIAKALEWDERFKANQAQKAAKAALDAEALKAREQVYGPPAPPPPEATPGALSYSAQVAAKYPETFNLVDSVHGIAVEIQKADGTVYPALLRGYGDNAAGELVPLIGRQGGGTGGWGHGPLREGETILTKVPDAAEWSKGVRDVFPTGTPEPTPAPGAVTKTAETPAPDTPPSDLGPETIEGENPDPTAPAPQTEPPFISEEELAGTKSRSAWSRIGGALRKINFQLRTAPPGAVALRRRLLEQRLEIQADADIPGAKEALANYQEKQGAHNELPPLAAEIRSYLKKNPLARPSAKEGAGELRAFRESLSDADARIAFAKKNQPGKSNLDRYGTDLVEHLQNAGVLEAGDPNEIAQRLFGANETGVLTWAAHHLGNEPQAPDVPFISDHGPDEGRFGIHRIANGDYVVSDESGLPIGTAKSAETAAEIAIDHHAAKTKAKEPIKAFQGRGATPEEIYGKDAVEQGRAVPVLGPGDYYATTEEDAGNYGAEITPHDVNLDNPLIIDSAEKWRELIKAADAPHLDTAGRAFAEHPENVPDDAAAVRGYALEKGYDGIIVRNVEGDKRLQEVFGHDTIVKYAPLPEELADARAKAQRLDAPADDQIKSVFLGTVNPAKIHLTRSVPGEVSSPDVIDALTRVLGAGGQDPRSLRFGRVPKRLRAYGYYSMRERLIRVQTSNNLSTAAHEVAHSIEDVLWGIGNVWKLNTNFTGAAKKELETLGQQLYKNRKPAGGYEAEGFAEFYRLYTFDPAQAKAKAPAFFDTWENVALPANPELQKSVKEAQRLGVIFNGQGSEARAKMGIVEQPSRLDKVKEFTEEQLRSARRKWIDAATPIRDFVDEANARRSAELPTEEDPFQTLTARRMTADAIAGYMATESMVDFAGNRTTGPLVDAFSIVHGNEDNFMIYLWAKRAQALWNDGRNGEPRNPGLAKVDADFLATHLHSSDFELAAQKVYDWNNGVLDYAAQASPDFENVVKKIRAVDPGFYIPLFREFKALDDRYTGQVGQGAIAGTKLLNRLHGSGRRITNPIESMLAQAAAIVGKAHNKAVLDQIFAIADSTPGLGHLVSEVPRDLLPQRIAGDKIAQRVIQLMKEQEAPGLDAAARRAFKTLNKGRSATPQSDAAADLIKDAIDGEMLTFFTPAYNPKQNEAPVLPVFRGGQMRWYEMDPELYKAVTNMDHVRLPRALDFFLGMPARMMRLGTTGLRATFSLVTNPLRDLRTLQMNSQASANSAQLFGHWISSLRDAATDTFSGGRVHSEWLDLAKRLGIEMAGSLTSDSRPLQTAARKLKRGGAWSPFDPKDSLEVLRSVLQFPETASRLAEVKAIAKDIGYDPSQPLTPAIAAKLATAGKQVTTDFTQAGEYARVLNQMIPFFNAGIQGPVAHVRAIQANPTRFVLRGLMGTAAALGLWWANKDEDWWKEMNTNERYLYTYIPVGKELLRIPRSYEVDGFFMAATEALADAWHNEDPRRMKEWFGRYAQQFAQVDMVDGFPVPPLPVLPKLVAEQLANRSFFFDRPIVPRGEQENVRPSEQYNEFTSNVAIEAGRILGISPRRIDHTINSLFGPVGGDVASLLGRGRDKIAIDREHEAADTPILGTIFQRGGQVARQPESIENLYKAYEQAIYIRSSKQEKETREQKDVRLMLADAVKVQTALSMIARTVPERDKRQELEALRRSVAHNAVEMARSGVVDRQPAKAILSEAKRLAREQQIPIGDEP